MKTFVNRIKNNKTFINGGLFSLFSFFSKGCAFFLLIILAKFIIPSDYGRLSMFNTIVTLLGFFIGLSTYGFVSISYFQKSLEEFKKDFTSIFVIHTFSFILLTAIVYFWGFLFVEKLEMTSHLMYFALIIAYLQLLFNIHQDFLRIQERVIEYGIWNCAFALCNLVLALLLVIYFKQGWLGKINAQFTCVFFVGILSIFYFLRGRFFILDFKWSRFKPILFFGLPLIPHTASGWIRQGCDTYIINYHYSTYEVGVFNFALNLVSVIIMIGSAFNATNQVSIYRILSDLKTDSAEKQSQLKKQTRIIGWMIISFSIIYVLGIIPIVKLAMPRYSSSIWFFLILSLYGIFQSFYFLYCNYFFYYKSTKKLMYITFSSSVLHLILSLLFTRYTLYFTALLYDFVQAVLLLLVYQIGKKILKKELEKKNQYEGFKTIDI